MDPRAAVNIYRREGISREVRPAFQFLEWRSHLAPQIILPRSRESFQSSRIYRRNSGVHDRRSTFLQPLSIWPSFRRSTSYARSSSLVGLCFFFALGVAWLGPASDELRIAVGRIFRQHICLFRVKTSFWVRQTEMEGPFLNANLRPPLLQMQR